MARKASVKRNTKETQISMNTESLDGSGKSKILRPASDFLIICWTVLPATDFFDMEIRVLPGILQVD